MLLTLRLEFTAPTLSSSVLRRPLVSSAGFVAVFAGSLWAMGKLLAVETSVEPQVQSGDSAGHTWGSIHN